MGRIYQVMEIGSGTNSIETTEAFNISGEYDMDAMWGTLTFNLPYLLPGQKNVTQSGVLDVTRLKKYDTVRLYYDELDTLITPIRPSDLKQVFYGYIDNIKLAKRKDDITYEISALGTLALARERNLIFERKQGFLQNIIIGSASPQGTLNADDIGILQLGFGAQTTAIIPQVDFLDVDVNTLVINIEGGKNLGDVLKQITEKYAVIIHQIGDGTLMVMTPFFLLNSRNNATLNVNGWEFELGVNVFELDYGDLSNNINSVVVKGYPPSVGVAIDPVMVQLNAGSGVTPQPEHYNYLVFELRDLVSIEDCQKVARQKLLEIARNYSVSFRTKFKPEFQIGQPFTLTDNDRFNTNQIWILKKFTFNLSKDDASATITGYAHALDMFPEDIVIDPTGIADVDVLELKDKVPPELNWVNLA